MGVLEGAIICRPDIRAHYTGLSASLVTNNTTKAIRPQSRIWGFKTRCKSIIQFSGLSLQPCSKRRWRVHCSFSSSSDGNGSMAGNFSENDEEYVNSSVMEAGNIFKPIFFLTFDSWYIYFSSEGLLLDSVPDF